MLPNWEAERKAEMMKRRTRRAKVKPVKRVIGARMIGKRRRKSCLRQNIEAVGTEQKLPRARGGQ